MKENEVCGKLHHDCGAVSHFERDLPGVFTISIL